MSVSGRIIRTSIINFWRNIWLSTAATLVMTITLVILTITMLFLNMTNYIIKSVQEKVDVSVYFKNQVSEQQILAVKDQIERMPEVTSVKYISAAEGQRIFRERHINSQDIIAALNELDNPIPATVQVKTRQLKDYAAVTERLKDQQYKIYIDKISFDDTNNRAVIERMNKIIDIAKKVGIVLAIIFSFLSIVVIFNTIRLTIFNRREEVEIMRLVGATNWYIRWPFIIESIFYAVAASVITFFLMLPLHNYILPRVSSYLGDPTSVSAINPYNLGLLFLMQLAVALALGVFSSFIAIRRYLKV